MGRVAAVWLAAWFGFGAGPARADGVAPAEAIEPGMRVVLAEGRSLDIPGLRAIPTALGMIPLSGWTGFAYNSA